MFLTYPSAELATHALRCLDQVLFGKNRLYVNRFGEIERYASMNIEEGSTPKNWPADSQPVDKVSGLPYSALCAELTMDLDCRNTFDPGWPILKVETNSSLSGTPLLRLTGAAVTLLPSELSIPIPNGQNSLSPGHLSVHTSLPCTDLELRSGRASLSRNRIDLLIPESDWSTSRHVKTTWLLSHQNLSLQLLRTLTRHRIPENSHRKTRETTSLFGKLRLDCYSELSLVKHLRLRLPPALILRISRLLESSPGHCCDGLPMTSTLRVA